MHRYVDDVFIPAAVRNAPHASADIQLPDGEPETFLGSRLAGILAAYTGCAPPNPKLLRQMMTNGVIPAKRRNGTGWHRIKWADVPGIAATLGLKPKALGQNSSPQT